MEQPDVPCWQCGAPARAACTRYLKLTAAAKRRLEAFGYEVKRGRRFDVLRVPVPRCAACQARNRLTIAIALCSLPIGAMALPLLWPRTFSPAWLQAGHEGPLGNLAALGAVAGFAIAVAGIALHRRLSGLRSLNDYPAIVTVRQAGWSYDHAHG